MDRMREGEAQKIRLGVPAPHPKELMLRNHV
jgi:hypothetical protein